MFPAFFEADAVSWLGRLAGDGGRGRRIRARVRCTELHPLHEVGDERGGQRLFRHAEILVPVADAFDEQAIVGLAGHDRRAGGAALGPAVAEVEAEVALGLLRVVAFVAMLHEHRTDALLEKGNPFLR